MYSRVEYMLCADSYMQMHILFCIRAKILILNMTSVYLSFVLQMAIISDTFMNGEGQSRERGTRLPRTLGRQPRGVQVCCDQWHEKVLLCKHKGINAGSASS